MCHSFHEFSSQQKNVRVVGDVDDVFSEVIISHLNKKFVNKKEKLCSSSNVTFSHHSNKSLLKKKI